MEIGFTPGGIAGLPGGHDGIPGGLTGGGVGGRSTGGPGGGHKGTPGGPGGSGPGKNVGMARGNGCLGGSRRLCISANQSLIAVFNAIFGWYRMSIREGRSSSELKSLSVSSFMSEAIGLMRSSVDEAQIPCKYINVS